MTGNTFLLYGANGYTGELIARYAAGYGLIPLLSGRNEAALEPLAHRLNLDYVVIDLNDKDHLVQILKTVKVVLHAAGPFRYTARQMVEACIETGTHYIDINGDISVFEFLKGFDERAKRSGIMLLPGAGFDVVPTDCLALLLKESIPDPVSLKLAFVSAGGLSHGTATTILGKLGEGSMLRKKGVILKVPLGQYGMEVSFFAGQGNPDKKLFVMSIPWGDISTAHFSTGIPNIETFTAVSKNVYRFLKFQKAFNWILRSSWIRNLLRKKVNRIYGPSDKTRSESNSMIWGQVTGKNDVATGRLVCPDAYSVTLHGCLLILKKVLEGNFKTGYQTPASAYGTEMVLEIPGVERDRIRFGH